MLPQLSKLEAVKKSLACCTTCGQWRHFHTGLLASLARPHCCPSWAVIWPPSSISSLRTPTPKKTQPCVPARHRRLLIWDHRLGLSKFREQRLRTERWTRTCPTCLETPRDHKRSTMLGRSSLEKCVHMLQSRLRSPNVKLDGVYWGYKYQHLLSLEQ